MLGRFHVTASFAMSSTPPGTPRSSPSRKAKQREKLRAINRGLFRTYVHVLFALLYGGFAAQLLAGAYAYWNVPCASHLVPWNVSMGSLYLGLALARFMMRSEARCDFSGPSQPQARTDHFSPLPGSTQGIQAPFGASSTC